MFPGLSLKPPDSTSLNCNEINLERIRQKRAHVFCYNETNLAGENESLQRVLVDPMRSADHV